MYCIQYPNEMFEYAEDSSPYYYSGYVDQVVPGIAYTSYSIWDTFRAEWAFLILFAPERIDGMLQSLLQVYSQSGRLPLWQNLVETNIMIGTHSSSLFAEALSKGFGVHLNHSLIWEALEKDAMTPPDNDTTCLYYDRQQNVGYEARAGLTNYMKLGYVAAGLTSEAGSRTLEYAYDDYTVGVAAMKLGLSKTSEENPASFYFQRSQNYRNLWNPTTQFMCARNIDGSWDEDSSTWTEASNWVYTFNVQHDFAGLRELFGSSEIMKKKLDDYFLDYHNLHPNEPSHATAYAYYYANAPDRLQEQIRHIMRLNYHAGPFGLSGEDGE
jgi:putative alpha-1,2-mannosidase